MISRKWPRPPHTSNCVVMVPTKLKPARGPLQPKWFRLPVTTTHNLPDYHKVVAMGQLATFLFIATQWQERQWEWMFVRFLQVLYQILIQGGSGGVSKIDVKKLVRNNRPIFPHIFKDSDQIYVGFILFSWPKKSWALRAEINRRVFPLEFDENGQMLTSWRFEYLKNWILHWFFQSVEFPRFLLMEPIIFIQGENPLILFAFFLSPPTAYKLFELLQFTEHNGAALYFLNFEFILCELWPVIYLLSGIIFQ